MMLVVPDSTLDLLVKAGPLGIVVLLVGAFGWFLRWLVTVHREERKEDREAFLGAIKEQRLDGVNYAESQRKSFLEHNAAIVRGCEEGTRAAISTAAQSQREWMSEWLPKILIFPRGVNPT